MAWRFVVLFSNGATRAWTLESVARLRTAQAWAIAAYARQVVDDWTWWTLWEPPTDPSCPACGYGYAPGRVRSGTCLCGVIHTRYDCIRDPVRFVPPVEPGCGQVPHDPGGQRRRQLRHRPR